MVLFSFNFATDHACAPTNRISDFKLLILYSPLVTIDYHSDS